MVVVSKSVDFQMRLDKFVASCANLTRTQARGVIRQGQIRVNEVTQSDPSSKVGDVDQIYWNNQQLTIQGETYIALYKPAGYVCSHLDDNYPSALTLVPEKKPEKLHFAGRLDADTSGLVLITSDGQWSHRVTSPRLKCSKVYRVGLAQAISDEDCEVIESGVQLNNESKLTLPANISCLSPTEILLTIQEGKYHQVKRMLAAVGNRVVSLHRESIGGIDLKGLEAGQFRQLTPKEVNGF